MSNYTKLFDYEAKDALLTGNPSKLVKGTELGAEFDAIATAVATKLDSAISANIAMGGYKLTGLGAGASATDSATIGGTETFTNKTLTAPTISGGTINGAAIGGTTPAAGTFTSISGATASDLTFNTGGSEQGRINSAGGWVLKSPSNSLALAINGRTSDDISSQYFYSNNGTTLQSSVTSSVAEFRDSSAAGVRTFYTGGSERMRIDSSGNVTLSSAAGLGYGTGAGGTVTQSTSKSTGVTLNKPTGEITMNNATLNNLTIVSFTLTNSVIAAGDLLIFNHISGGTIGAYTFNAQCASGSATITVRNATGSNLSEAVVIRFAIIKGATA